MSYGIQAVTSGARKNELTNRSPCDIINWSRLNVAVSKVKPELHRRITFWQVSTKGGKLLLCKSFTFEADFASQNACFEVKPELEPDNFPSGKLRGGSLKTEQ